MVFKVQKIKPLFVGGVVYQAYLWANPTQLRFSFLVRRFRHYPSPINSFEFPPDFLNIPICFPSQHSL